MPDRLSAVRFKLTLILILLLATSLHAADFDFPVDQINHALNCIFIDTSDVSFRTDHVERDSFRLNLIDQLTVKPLEIPGFLYERSQLLRDSSKSVSELVDTALAWLDIPRGEVTPAMEPSGYWEEPFPAEQGVNPTLSLIAEKTRTLMSRMDQAHETVAVALSANLTQPEIAFVRDTFPTFLLEDENAMNLSVEEQDSLQKLSEGLALRFKEFGYKVDIATILQAQKIVIAGFEDLLAELKKDHNELARLSADDVRRLLPPMSTPIGVVVFGSSADDRYQGDYAVIVDFGGNDTYYLSTPEKTRQQVIIDLAGNDFYIADSNYALACGLTGCGILADMAGDDIYLAKHFALGCGMFGCGILLDESGDDYYKGDICVEGASGFGVGLMIDRQGDDIYEASLFSQAFGFIKGVGLLIDDRGNDQYAVGWKYGDVLRYENHYITLSQGFGYGLRPHFSGGIGLLIEGDGNDSYNADIFGQGASYWFSLGGLVDFAGTDRYVAHQYAQGAATHLCLAALVDVDGPDVYLSKGVSQGCGHDLAFGLLLDCGGDDQYSAYDLSQAAGSANGTGMLIDLAGNDGYLVRTKTNTHGYGNPRRDYGSIGLFLDLGGSDVYSGYGADSSYWVTDSKWGIGADIEVEASDAK